MDSAGGSRHEWPPQMGLLTALRLAPLHLRAASEKGVQNDSVFQTGTFNGSDQMESLFLLSNTHEQAYRHIRRARTHTCILYSSSSQWYKARIMMTGGGVMRLSSACSH